MKYFVYYRDDYKDNGGEGLKECKDEAAAIAFIESRLKVADQEFLSEGLDECYKVIFGTEKKIKTAEKVTRVIIER